MSAKQVKTLSSERADVDDEDVEQEINDARLEDEEMVDMAEDMIVRAGWI